VVGVALERVRRKFNLPALAHNHDFYWERKDICLTCSKVIEIIDKYYPPRHPLIKHVVINSLAKKELVERKGIYATIVPNVFDFDPPSWCKDEYNSDFRRRIGLKENDILILQATRIVPRKGIELAIDFVEALDTPERRSILMKKGLYNGKKFLPDSRIVLVLAGYEQDDISGTYLKNLKIRAKRSGVDMIHIADIVKHQRGIIDGKKVFSLWDTYVFADFVTYPSQWEGWGNQFLEAIRAKLPMMVFEYPVFIHDIKPKGFDVISLGSEILNSDSLGFVDIPMDRIQKAADEAVWMLVDKNKRLQTVEHNFNLAKELYSLDALHQYLEKLI
jgi:glycosyltransferase involved in cell wall biosynthesis